MKTIRVSLPPPSEQVGRCIVQPVVVNWFPPLSMDQIMENAVAALDGCPTPHPDPNLIIVEIER